MKKIAIVGSGIGGSGIGALLSTEKKYDIVVLEKSNLIGGRCASYKRTDKQGREWIFDVGCHTFSTCDKGPLGEILRRCGKENAVKWIYTPITTNLMGVVTSPGAKKKTARTHGPQKEKPEKKIKKNKSSAGVWQ